MAASEGLQLAVPTNRTMKGPILTHQGEQLIVDYDFESDDGSDLWGRIVFEEILAYEYLDISSCTAGDVLAPAEIRRRVESDYLSLVTSRWQASVGTQAWQQRKGGRERFQHFTIYFDDVCCVNVVASSCKVLRLPVEKINDDA